MKQLFNRFAARLRRLGGAAPSPTPGPASTSASSRPDGWGTTTAHVPAASVRGRHLAYAPEADGRADPGEIVWFRVAFEDEPSQGKDRPVLVVGRDGDVLLGLMLSSQHTRDGQPNWLPLGAGDWDREARPSWVRLDRVLTVPEGGIRREGAVLDRPRFDTVAGELRRRYGWT